jgi:hypothetical protein
MAQVIATLGAGRPDASLACTTKGLFERDCVATICPLPETMVKVCDWTKPVQNAQINKARIELQTRDEIIGKHQGTNGQLQEIYRTNAGLSSGYHPSQAK